MTFIFKRENIDKALKEQKYGRHNQIQAQGSIMHGEGILTKHTWCTQ